MFKKIAAIVVVLVVAAIMFTFTYANTGTVRLDLAFGVIEPAIPLAFSITFIAGWAFGLFCSGLFLFRRLNERRQLRNSLRAAEAEVSRLRSLPIADAD